MTNTSSRFFRGGLWLVCCPDQERVVSWRGLFVVPIPHLIPQLTNTHAVPALLIGVILGPVGAKFLDPEKWGSATPGQEPAITLGVMRVMIGIQL